MANRKVLINYHTSGSSAPTPANVYLGELVVAHETGKETIWTKNNAGVMVPFVSCAQTIAMINNLVETSEDNVVAADNEAHLSVATASTEGGAKTWTLSTDDVQSEEEFKEYSARTNSALTALTKSFADLLDIALTGGSGDDIITVSTASTDVSANTFTVTHKTATAVTGFNKLDTDAYGHVTAATPVAASDIKALGFEDSAWTEEAITNAINDLDSAISASTTGKYLTAISIKDGLLDKIEEADIPVLEVESAGTGNVVSSIAVNDHEITYQTVSVATSEAIQELSAATESFSAGTYSEFTSAFTAINNLSADTEAADGKVFTSAKTYADELIAALDSSTATTDNRHYLTAVTITDGIITSMGEAEIPELASAVTGNGNVVTDIAVDDHTITFTKGLTVAADSDLRALSAAVETNEDNIESLSAGTLHDIGVLSGAVKANETNITTVSGDVIELSAATVAIETGLDNLSAVTLTGVSLNNTPLTVTDHVVSVPVTTSGSGIANATESGSVADALAVKEYVQNTVSSAVEYKGATNDVPTGTPVKGDLWIASSAFNVDGQNVEIGDFIIYDGTQWQVIEKNLDGAITGNLTQNTVTLGDSTNSVKSLANGANGTVLTMVDGAPAWADDPELTVVSAGTGNVLTDITVDDHEITFTKGITAASDADLQALSGAVEDFSGATDAKFIELSAYTKDVDDKVKALSAGTIQLSADTVAYVDAQIDEVYASGVSYTDAKVAAEIALLDSSTAVTTGKYITGIAIADGKISGITEESLPANVPITATTGAAVDTPSAVLTGVTADGADNHNLTFGMSNKVFSAATSDSALTSESALTAVHANAAAKVDSALTINIIDATGGTATTVFDGSENQIINLTNTDTATTEAGHYTPATAASAFTAPAGSFLSGVSVDSKNHVLEVAYADKINSATTSESADTAAVADKVANALSVSGYSSETAATLDTAVAYDGSAAQSLTFGTVGNAGLNSMTMTNAGVVDVEVIDCGEY